MLALNGDEKILKVIRKHWFVLARTVAIFIFLLLLPPLILTILPMVTSDLDPALVLPLTNLFLALYIMVLLIFLFLLWMDYYLDMWIITSERIIDVEQKGLFNRHVAEIPLQHVQDVTLEVKGIIETFLKFGTIRIQTAGEREFKIEFVPNLYEAKDLILKYTTALQKSIRS
jgi:uncharacterized membrane protein YdbT with pleckstrin-like domain